MRPSKSWFSRTLHCVVHRVVNHRAFDRIVKLQFPGDPAGLSWCKSLIQCGGRVRIEVINHQFDHVRLWKMNVHQLLHLHGEIALGAAWGDVDMPPAMQRLDKEKQIRCTLPTIFVVVAGGLSRARWRMVGPRSGDCVLMS